ncbi:phage tail protein [Providencia sp. 2024EL-00606]|uniref:phage tail-collar fiber domain-containing protein n=1 Tax=Providencia sp. 2024EL-00606 TaxID=3350765 RepID=UPI0024AC38CB|nr:phage tail protein [Providencia rettgeri]MDX4118437.1 phage tail protein [Providencia rettgeri]
MKYFALLTKLGENLLAQATALGTKIELTQMAVGDGGGKLPTPDTNQTKLIAEKRRAAINTLFIDDNNKNQIVAEQIIPEQEGGWWIREIGLFDKTGNLIAVANCPETYKPQLAEGSGRTQAIRMVLIVSHTESVTLKIDPSVVLATREYVNTEITVIDKKIDALSAQTKLDLNKKFDKANISSQKGNDNDKVPSLNLFTTEIGKLAALGYSYSKIESDGRYQPKGNYAPAGDYATNAALNNGLNGKFDKAGGTIAGHITAEGNIQSNSGKVTANSASATGIQLDGTGSVAKIRGRAQSGLWYDHFLPEKTGTFQQIGDFGLGVANYPASGVGELNETMFLQYGSTLTATSEGFPGAGGGVQISYQNNKRAQLFINRNPLTLSYRFSDVAGKDTVTPWIDVLSTSNTIVDRNGNLKTTGTTELSDYPIGAPIPWPQSTVPAGYLALNGQTFNKTTYPLLAKAYPSGVLDDMRAEFIRGLDAGRGIDSGRVALSAQGDAMRKITGGNLRVWASADSSKPTGAFNGATSNNGAPGSGSTPLYEITFDSERVVPTAAEVRPRNKAFLYIVRAA